MEKMLTRHNIIAETPHVEAIPINLIATEDGRTLLAVAGEQLLYECPEFLP